MNEELIHSKLDGLKELFEVKLDSVNAHLKSLNGQVSKNTSFRQKGSVYIGIGAFIISVVTTLIFKFI